MSSAFYEIRHLEFAYPKQAPLLDSINLELLSTEIVLLTGANGSGKSTLCRLLTGLQKNYLGQLLALGKEMTTWESHRLAERILYLKQEGMLNVVAATPMQDLAIRQHRYLSSDTSQLLGDREDALQQTGLFQFRDTPIWELSAGQVKRISLSALPLFPFHYWILDEPFLGLDAEWSSRLTHWLEERKAQNRGALIITHQAEQVEHLYHQHYHLENGKITRVKHG